MGINSQSAIDAINAPLPFEQDLIEGMAMRLWHKTKHLIDIFSPAPAGTAGIVRSIKWTIEQKEDAVFQDLPKYHQDELRHIAVSMLGCAVAAIYGDGECKVDRLNDLHDFLSRHPGPSGEVTA